MTIDTETLRSASKRNDVYKSAMQGLLAWAADRIDAQTAEIARLREALKDLMVASPSHLNCEEFHHNPSDRHADADVCQPVKRYQDALEAASAALSGESK